MRISDWSSDVCSSDLDQPARIHAVQVDAAGLALQEGGDFIHMDAGGLDAQQVAQRQGVAPLLQRQHHLAGGQADHEIGEVVDGVAVDRRSEEHTSELQSLMRISYAVFCLKKKTNKICSLATTRE